MKHKYFEKHQFVANFLAKFPNSYKSLNLGNKTQSHDFISKKLVLTKESFVMLRSEYDGFYEFRKGLPEPYKRKTRVIHKEKYHDLDFNTYLTLVNEVLQNPDIEINLHI